MSDEKLILKSAPESVPVAEPKRTTVYPVHPSEYRTAALAHIGDGDAEPHPGDERLPFEVADSPITGRIPEPPVGSLEESIVRLRRATRDAGSLFDND